LPPVSDFNHESTCNELDDGLFFQRYNHPVIELWFIAIPDCITLEFFTTIWQFVTEEDVSPLVIFSCLEVHTFVYLEKELKWGLSRNLSLKSFFGLLVSVFQDNLTLKVKSSNASICLYSFLKINQPGSIKNHSSSNQKLFTSTSYSFLSQSQAVSHAIQQRTSPLTY